MKDFLKKMRNNEIENEMDEIKKYETIRSFGDGIYTGKIKIDEAEIDQNNILKNIVEFNNKSRPIENKVKKRDTYESAYALYEG